MEAVSQPYSDEQLISEALSKLSPSQIKKSKVLRACFEDFFNRGTLQDCLDLFSATHRTALSTGYGLTFASLSPAVSEPIRKGDSTKCATPIEGRVDACPSEPPTSDSSQCQSHAVKRATAIDCHIDTRPPDPTASDSSQYECHAVAKLRDTFILPSQKPAPRPGSLDALLVFFSPSKDQSLLARLTKSILSAEIFNEDFYEALWSAKDGPFDGLESLSRICRLQQGWNKLMRRDNEYRCAYPLILLFQAHEVDECERTLTNVELNLSSGSSRKTGAFKKVAEISGKKVKDVKFEYGKCRNYLILAREMPGILLCLGLEAPSHWERIHAEDMLRIVECLKNLREDQSLPVANKLHKTLNKIKHLDKIAARCITRGLAAYGWTDAELRRSTSPLIQAVRKRDEPASKTSQKRRHSDDGDIEYPKRGKACRTRNFSRAASSSDKTAEDQHPAGPSPSTTELSPSSEAAIFSGSEQPPITDGSVVSTPDDATSFSDLRLGSELCVGAPKAYQAQAGESQPREESLHRRNVTGLGPDEQIQLAGESMVDEVTGSIIPSTLRDSSQLEGWFPSEVCFTDAQPGMSQFKASAPIGVAQLSQEDIYQNRYHHTIAVASSCGCDPSEFQSHGGDPMAFPVPQFRECGGDPMPICLPEFRTCGGDRMIGGWDVQ